MRDAERVTLTIPEGLTARISTDDLESLLDTILSMLLLTAGGAINGCQVIQTPLWDITVKSLGRVGSSRCEYTTEMW